ncbi:MAG: hypothetical protein RLZZ67_360 [Candidatus Parcubacteria bacterium]|jgi:hypothetical protein
MTKSNPISKETLTHLYTSKKLSTALIAKELKQSQRKIDYWITKYNIKKRTISEAIYELRNPNGDPFKFTPPQTKEDALLYALGLGLYWGEGAKRGKGGVRLANTDMKLVKIFIRFLQKFFNVDKKRLRFGLQIFDDINPNAALNYWMKQLDVPKEQFYKVIVSKVRGTGTYTYRSEYGVLMVYFNNIKLKALICELIDNLE